MASACMVISRQISTSAVCHGKRNFRKFLLYNKRGSRIFKEEQAKNPNCDIPIDKRGVRDTGKYVDGKWVNIPEMIPELIVPSLEGFDLKPYVTYRVTEELPKDKFTPSDLFIHVYADKIEEDFKNGKLLEDGQPMNPSEFEKLTPEEAKIKAEQTGADMFTMDRPGKE